jgi:hypothetical protein
MIVLIRLKSFEVINLSIVEAKGVTEIVEGMARTVVSIVAMLMNMRVRIAVQNCYSQIVG